MGFQSDATYIPTSYPVYLLTVDMVDGNGFSIHILLDAFNGNLNGTNDPQADLESVLNVAAEAIAGASGVGTVTGSVVLRRVDQSETLIYTLP